MGDSRKQKLIGQVGDVFRFDAKELFVEYASHCNDKEKIADIILKLNS
jgi:hypothetical protein